MERQKNKENLYSKEMLNLVNTHVDEAISNALNSLTRILSLPCISLTTSSTGNLSTTSFSNPSNSHSLQPTVLMRCRSSSRNNRRERDLPFHHTIPRCSLPATKNDFVQYQSRQQTNQTRCRSSQSVSGGNNNNNNNNINRTYDVQYSFSLNKPWLTKIDKQRHYLISIQNFVNELIEHSIRAAFLQIDYQYITNNNNTTIYDDDTSCLLFDCSPSYIPIERSQTINSYIDQLIHSTIKQSIDDLSYSNENLIERLSNRLTEDVINDALSTITDDDMYSKSLLTDDEKHTRKTKKRSTGTIRLINNENNESQTNIYHQIRHRSSSAFRTITNNNTRRETVDSIVNNIAQQIYIDSVDELRQ